ncbi:MAG: HNH endonuclease, partial [Acidimicrobiales bacterium]
CKRTFGLEHDHTDPVAHTGRTTYQNLRDRCYPCHAVKTERDRLAGLLGKRAKARGPGPPVKSTARTKVHDPAKVRRTAPARRVPPNAAGPPEDSP